MIKVLNFQESNDAANSDRNAKPTILVGDFDTFLSIINRSTEKKLVKLQKF